MGFLVLGETHPGVSSHTFAGAPVPLSGGRRFGLLALGLAAMEVRLRAHGMRARTLNLARRTPWLRNRAAGAATVGTTAGRAATVGTLVGTVVAKRTG